MAHDLDLDIRGMLEAQNLLALMQLPLPKRKRLLNNVVKRVRSLSRKRIRDQKNIDGSSFEARKGTSKGKKKMEAGLGKLLEVTRLTGVEAELGWRNTLTRWIASQQHYGISERRTAAQMRQWNKVSEGTAATEKQAKQLRRLGFKTRQVGQKSPTRPSVTWIQQHLNYTRAGLLIRVLDGEQAQSSGAQSWNIKLPARQILGASTSETSQLVNLVLQQILNSPR
ncbi:Prophage PSPPH06, virion morphoproteinsis protein [Pseudomonas syringae pv. tagetis]|uniref:Prophage PSPPH06, virion morphoproteinsis protein n=1 Tax=Pseudomonas syringae pv. tagetis TaxID=129140 RepID=A0A3M3YYR5_9PSED|nr:phage virion morphogenesis protein [Pseudomonas syringae group genomosp. 7]RMO87039.1 Prophage PSPPH06, virion morphoproteinsis protein [Pseudomonas syringae pv. tagetis]